MMLRILIYDDDPAACQTLRELLRKLPDLQKAEILTAVNLREARGHLTKKIDILFQDIELPERENGIAFARQVKAAEPETSIIFITAHIKYCEEIFSASPAGFLVKPFTAEKVHRTLQILRSTAAKADFLSVSTSKNNLLRIPLEEVAYFESQGRKVYVHGKNDSLLHIITGTKLNELEQQLPKYFVRCHHSFCVNLHTVRQIERYHFTLSDGTSVPISQQRFSAAKEKFINFMGDRL